MLVHIGTVNGFVAAGGPAGALLQPAGVITVADENLAVAGLLLEMAFQAEIGAPLREQFLVHRPMRRMAGNTTLAYRFVLENKRSALRGMALEAGPVRAQHGDAATLHALRHIRSAAFDCIALMRVMAIGATDFALEDGMMVR